MSHLSSPQSIQQTAVYENTSPKYENAQSDENYHLFIQAFNEHDEEATNRAQQRHNDWHF